MNGILGNIFLYIGLISCLWQASNCANNKRILAASTIALSLFLAFVVLLYAHITSDFSLLNVFNNSHQAKPLLYKIAGTWGNHEGSILLMTFILSVYQLILAIKQKNYHEALKIHAIIIIAFIGFMLFTSNPFTMLKIVPESGLGLNPVLQDMGLAIHPPILYMGYLGLSVVFALAIYAQISNEEKPKIIAAIKCWNLISFSFLTLGIALGSWWAYRELGWGGYWFWDPVENVSLMPWLISTALLHSIVIFERKDSAFYKWIILLANFAFILSLIGIFFVRSGILTSVHSFASDPARGIYILIFLGFVLIGSIITYYKYTLYNKKLIIPAANLQIKEVGLLLNNLFLVVFCLTILLSIVYPIIMQLFFNQFISVAAPYFNIILRYISVPFLILASIVPALNIGTIKENFNVWIMRTIPSLLMAIFATIITGGNLLFTTLGWWIIFISLHLLFKRGNKISIYFLSSAIAHVGLGLLVISLSVLNNKEIEKQVWLKPEQTIIVADYAITLKDMTLFARDNYMLRQGVFDIAKNNKKLATLTPETRFFPIEAQTTSESAIYTHRLSDLYLVLGEVKNHNKYELRIYYKPMVRGIWLGAILMCVGGILSIISKYSRSRRKK